MVKAAGEDDMKERESFLRQEIEENQAKFEKEIQACRRQATEEAEVSSRSYGPYTDRIRTRILTLSLWLEAFQRQVREEAEAASVRHSADLEDFLSSHQVA